MKNILTTAALAILLTLSFSSTSFASDTQEAFNKCKAEADSDEVTSADMKTYISNCMNDMGIDVADAKKVVDEEIQDEQK